MSDEDEVAEDLDDLEDEGFDDELEELDDEDFDPEISDDELEPGLDDELVGDPALDAEDDVIERSLAVDEDEPEGAAVDITEVALDDVEEDEDEDEIEVDVLVVDDDDEDEVDGLREGEFICSSCYLAKGPSQLADAKRLICVDCI